MHYKSQIKANKVEIVNKQKNIPDLINNLILLPLDLLLIFVATFVGE